MRIEKINLPADGITYPGTTGAEPLGMPIGGIGASTFEIGRDGAFKNNRLQNGWTTSLPQRPKGIDDGSFISVCVSRENGKGIGRIMQLDAPGGLPGVPGLQYTGRFPFVDLDYDDPQLPAAVKLEVFSPFIPLQADDSALPIAFFTVKIHNPGRQPIRAGAAMSWVNDIVYENYFRGWAAIGNRNEIAGHGGAPAVRMTTLDDALAGSEYLLAGIKQKGVRWQAVADWRPQAPGRVIGVRAVRDVPQLVGTDWHITQGGVEFDAVEYDPRRQAMVCRGLRARRPGHLFIYLPEKFRRAKGAGGDTAAVRRLRVDGAGSGDLVLPV